MKNIYAFLITMLFSNFLYSAIQPALLRGRKPVYYEASFSYNPFVLTNISNTYYRFNDFNTNLSLYKKISSRYAIGGIVAPVNIYIDRYDEEAYYNDLIQNKILADQPIVVSERKRLVVSHDILFANRIYITTPKKSEPAIYFNVNGGVKVTSFVQQKLKYLTTNEVEKVKFDAGAILGLVEFKLGYSYFHINAKQVLDFKFRSNVQSGLQLGAGFTYQF